jgi:hypothetical protein
MFGIGDWKIHASWLGRMLKRNRRAISLNVPARKTQEFAAEVITLQTSETSSKKMSALAIATGGLSSFHSHSQRGI